MKIYPNGDRLYVILDPVQEVTSGKIYIPDQHSENTRVGTVKAIGPEVKHFKEGDRVLAMYYSGIVIDRPSLYANGEGQDIHRIFREDEILCVTDE